MTTFGVTEKRADCWKVSDGGIADFIIPGTPFAVPGREITIEQDYEEYRRTELAFNNGLLMHDGFLFHASALAYKGKGFCFCGPSGMGKSTHTALWKEYFGSAVTVIDDDKPALRYIDGRWRVFGTPWCGKTDMTLNVGYPLEAVIMLARGADNVNEGLSDFKKLNYLSSCVTGPLTGKNRLVSLQLLDSLINTVPVWRLCCKANTDAVKTVYNEIVRRGIINENQG